MTIGISLLTIQKRHSFEGCFEGWLWAMPIYSAETKKEKDKIKRKIKEIFKNWNTDNKKNPKTEYKIKDLKNLEVDKIYLINKKGEVFELLRYDLLRWKKIL